MWPVARRQAVSSRRSVSIATGTGFSALSPCSGSNPSSWASPRRCSSGGGPADARPGRQGDVVMVLGPADPAEHFHKASSPCRRRHADPGKAAPGHARFLIEIEGIKAHHRLAVRALSCPRGPDPGWRSAASVSVRVILRWHRPRPPMPVPALKSAESRGVSLAMRPWWRSDGPGPTQEWISARGRPTDHRHNRTTSRETQPISTWPSGAGCHSGMDLASRSGCLGRGLQAMDRYGGG
jgi:hypothetical protein